MKPFYKSKKFWTAIVTSLAMIVAYLKQDEKLALLITAIGTALIAGFGLADFGKERDQ
jgi:H+/gluconate symporter-like permease